MKYESNLMQIVNTFEIDWSLRNRVISDYNVYLIDVFLNVEFRPKTYF